MKYNQIMLVLLATASMAGCGSIRGADPVLDPSGVYTNRIRQSDGMSVTPADVNAFTTLYSASSADPTSTTKAYSMLIAGLSLVRSNCGYYFTSTGHDQKWIFVAQDAIGAAGTLATGVMGALGAGTPSIAWVGLATGTAYSGINIYTKNFLFASENIASVQTAVTKQLDQDRTDIMSDWSGKTAPDGTKYTYYMAKEDVLDEQDVCTDVHILALVHNVLNTSAAETPSPAAALVGSPAAQ